jgi:hypothetical protein
MNLYDEATVFSNSASLQSGKAFEEDRLGFSLQRRDIPVNQAYQPVGPIPEETLKKGYVSVEKNLRNETFRGKSEYTGGLDPWIPPGRRG